MLKIRLKSLNKIRNLLLFAVVSCQTLPKTYLPQDLAHDLFSDCAISGSVSFRLFHQSDYLGSGFLDWETGSGLDVTDSLGNPVSMLKKGETTTVNFNNTLKVDIELDDAGKITIADKFSGLYLDELLCVLAGKLPRHWYQERVTAENRTAWLMTLTDRGRRIVIETGFTQFKVRIYHRFLWLFPVHLLSLTSNQQQTGSMTGGELELKWKSLP